MSKKPDSYSDDTNGEITVAIMPKKHKRLSKKRLLLLLVVCILVIAGATAGVLVGRSTPNQPVDLAKVQALVRTNDCSAAAVQSVADEQPNAKQPNAAITLLSYRLECFNRANQYRQAAAVLQQLEPYIAAEHDTAYVQQINQEIAQDNYAATHPITSKKVKPEISAAEARRLDLSGITQ